MQNITSVHVHFVHLSFCARRVLENVQITKEKRKRGPIETSCVVLKRLVLSLKGEITC